MNRKEGHNDFNVYYMNFSKVYEIAMMINNQIVKSYQREKGQQVEDTYSLDSLIEEEEKQNICPYCKTELVARKGKYGDFYGCSNYPKCKFTKKMGE